MIRVATKDDIQDLSTLLFNFLSETYPTREVKGLDACTSLVTRWLDARLDVYIVDGGKGFFLGFIDDNSGTLSPVYRAEISYLLPKYRGKTRLGYELLTLPLRLQGILPRVSKATRYNGVHKMHMKLGGKPIFIEMERA
jgi:hypothetical protein